MDTITTEFKLEVFQAGLRGTAYAPGDESYYEARSAWNLNADQRPALVVMAEDAADIVAAVRGARRWPGPGTRCDENRPGYLVE